MLGETLQRCTGTRIYCQETFFFSFNL